MEKGKVIATHQKLIGKKQYSVKIVHYLETLKKKPGALPGSKAFKGLEKQLKDLYTYYDERVIDYIDILSLLKIFDE